MYEYICIYIYIYKMMDSGSSNRGTRLQFSGQILRIQPVYLLPRWSLAMSDPIFQEIDPATNGDFHGKFGDKPRSFGGISLNVFANPCLVNKVLWGSLRGDAPNSKR